jgi:hypothetical protein
MGLHFTRMSDEALARIARSAAKYLEPGEKVRVVVWHRTRLNGLLRCLGGG